MKLFAVLLAVFALGVALPAAPVGAHHSTNGIYNEDEVVELTGTVREWRFINPHPSLVIEVAGPDGEIQEWDVSYGGPAVTHLKQQGYTAETFRPGDVIVVRGYAAKVQTAYGLLILGHPTREDGTAIAGSGR
jgi:hypothetical protein